MKKLNVALAIFVTAVMAGNAQTNVTVTSDIVGYESKSLPADSYTSVGINLLNPPVLVSSVSGATSTALNVSGSSNVGALLTSTEPYYIEVKSGALEGCRLDVDVAATISAANGSIVINGLSDNNTDPYGSIYNTLTGANLVLRKHVTLSDIATQITNLSSGASGTGDEILVLNPATGGFDSYLRRKSTEWRDANAQNANSVAIAPGVGIIIKKAGVEGSITVVGGVRQNNFSLNVKTGYQLVTLGYPLDRSPSDIGANVSANGWTYGASGDQFMLLNSGGGFDAYLYRKSDQWRDANATDMTTTKFLTSGNSYVLYRNTDQNFDFVKPSF